MKRNRPSEKTMRAHREIVGEDPSLAAVAPLFLYRGDVLHKLDYLAFALNSVAPDSPTRSLTDTIKRLVTHLPSKKDWIKRYEGLIGPTIYTPAPDSPLDLLNNHLKYIPCLLRIEGYERANGDVEVGATHIPLPAPALIAEEFPKEFRQKAMEAWLERTRGAERILWLVWEIFFQKVDLARLKKCDVCGKWFVDRTKNRSKKRCSPPCTWQYWSWGERKQAGHKLPGKKPRKSRVHASAGKRR